MTNPYLFRLRSQAELEAELLTAIDELLAADPTNEERVSWWGGQVVALLWALGTERGDAIETMYQTWRARDAIDRESADD